MRRKSHRQKVPTTVSLDPELKAQAQAAGINLSSTLAEALRAKLDRSHPKQLALKFDLERSNLNSEIEHLQDRKEKVEAKACKVLGCSLDDYLTKEQLDETDRWAEAKEAVKQRLISDPGKQRLTEWKLASMYEVILGDLGITGQDQVVLCQQALLEVQNQGGMYQ